MTRSIIEYGDPLQIADKLDEAGVVCLANAIPEEWLAHARADVEDALRHMLRSARAAGHRIVVLPARCRSCGFTFDEDKLTKPGKCPSCRGSRIFEPQISLDRA